MLGWAGARARLLFHLPPPTSQPASPLPLLYPISSSSSSFASAVFHLQWTSPAALTQVHKDRRRSDAAGSLKIRLESPHRRRSEPRNSRAAALYIQQQNRCPGRLTLKANGIPKSTRIARTEQRDNNTILTGLVTSRPLHRCITATHHGAHLAPRLALLVFHRVQAVWLPIRRGALLGVHAGCWLSVTECDQTLLKTTAI